MRYAIGLSLIGMGSLLIYGGFTDQSVWGLVSSALTGEPYVRRSEAKWNGAVGTGTPKNTTNTEHDSRPLPTVSDPLGNGIQVA